jgi:nicotinate-nucleotide--dimethylbenzimidazole phosphoribosyltransferase
MVANFAAGGAAINHLARIANANLRVVPLALDQPTRDFTREPAMNETEFLDAVNAGFAAVALGTDRWRLAKWALATPLPGRHWLPRSLVAAGRAGRGGALASTTPVSRTSRG